MYTVVGANYNVIGDWPITYRNLSTSCRRTLDGDVEIFT